MFEKMINEFILFVRTAHADNWNVHLCQALNSADIYAELIDGRVLINGANVAEPITISI